MKSTWVRFLILAVLGFVLGAGFALVQRKAPPDATPVAETAPVAAAAPAAEQPAAGEEADPVVGALPASENVSQPEMMAGVPVGGAFSLVDHKGNPVTEKSWPGKYRLVFFGFTHCPDICPAAMQKFSAVMENFDPAGQKLAPMLITVDPERDTVAVMAEYVSHYNPHIVGLTGTRDQIDEVINAYKVFSAKVPDNHEYHHEGAGDAAENKDYMVDHSGYAYLMSPDDKPLEIFSTGETAEGMIAKIKAHVGQTGETAPVSTPVPPATLTP